MNRFCERCERTTHDGNLWCPDPDCPAEAGYVLFGYGDFLGDLKITKLVRAWRTAALYEAERGKTPVLVKVAYPHEETEERLRREAQALASLAPKPSAIGAFFASFRPSPRPVLLRPLSPYPTPAVAKRPYGEISFRGETKVFSVFQYAKGKLLSDVLLENPQLWHQEVAWVISTLAETLRPLAAKNRCHLSLTPDVILVDMDSEGHLRPTFLDLGFLLEGREMESVADWLKLCEPAYTAPELLNGKRIKSVNPTADVYSLGMIFYEMLAGRPGFEPKLRRDERVRELVAKGAGSLPVERPELPKDVIEIVDRAIARTNRFNTVTELGDALTAIYSTPPKEKRPTPRRFYVLIISLMGLLLIVAAVVGYVLLQVWLATR